MRWLLRVRGSGRSGHGAAMAANMKTEAMAQPKSIPDPSLNDGKERAGRRRIWALLLISLVILAAILFTGTLLLRTEQPEPEPRSLVP